MSDKETRDYWSEGGQIFFHYGKAYGVAPDLTTACLGSMVQDQGWEQKYRVQIKPLSQKQKGGLPRQGKPAE